MLAWLYVLAHPINRLNPPNRMFCSIVIRPWAVPSFGCSTRYATDGHITAGINENATPIIAIGRYRLTRVYAIIRYTGIRSDDPTIIRSARLPTRSTHKPKIGVAIMAKDTIMLDRNPPNSREVPWASIKNFTANV